MLELIQPYLSDIVEILLSIVLMLIAGALVELRRRTLKWIESRTNKEQRELLHRLAEEAFSFAETEWKHMNGPDKLAEAVHYASIRLKSVGIELTVTEIKSAIEKAVLEYNSKVKGKTDNAS